MDLNSYVRVRCDSTVTPKWYHVNLVPAESDKMSKVIFTNVVSTQSTDVIKLSKVQLNDYGYYYCYGQREEGDYFFARFELQVYGKPTYIMKMLMYMFILKVIIDIQLLM